MLIINNFRQPFPPKGFQREVEEEEAPLHFLAANLHITTQTRDACVCACSLFFFERTSKNLSIKGSLSLSLSLSRLRQTHANRIWLHIISERARRAAAAANRITEKKLSPLVCLRVHVYVQLVVRVLSARNTANTVVQA